MKSSAYTLHRQFGTKRGNLSQSRWSHLRQTSQKLLKPNGFKEVVLHRVLYKSRQAPLSEGKCKYWPRLSTYVKTNCFWCLKLVFLVVHTYGVIFSYTVYWTGSILSFSYSEFYLIKVFLVLDLNSKYLWLRLNCLSEHPPDDNSGNSPRTRAEMVTNQANLCLVAFNMHDFVPCPQFCSLLKPITSVHTKISWFFPLMLVTVDPCAFNCMSHFISQSLHSFTKVATQNLAQLMLFWCQCCVRSSRSGSSRISYDACKRIDKVLPISHNKQWAAGNCGLPGLSGCHTSSLFLVPLFFPVGTMPSSKSFSVHFLEASGFCPQ
jgi:hypothetical protein